MNTLNAYVRIRECSNQAKKVSDDIIKVEESAKAKAKIGYVDNINLSLIFLNIFK